jgi:hypothetical protein
MPLHYVPGRFTRADLTDGLVLTTVAGRTLTVSVSGGTVTVGGIEVTSFDLIATNGVGHVIEDAILIDNTDGPTASTTTAAATTIEFTTAVPTTSSAASSCQCPANQFFSGNPKNKNVNINFKTTCASGHRMGFCVQRVNSGSQPIIVSLQVLQGGTSVATPVLGPLTVPDGAGERLCVDYIGPATDSQKGDRWIINVSNNNRATYKLFLVRNTISNAGHCVAP